MITRRVYSIFSFQTNSRNRCLQVHCSSSYLRLVVWPFHAAQVETPVYRTQRRRSWRKFDVDQFRADLQSSCLCDGFINSSLGDDDSLGDDASVMASRLDE